MIILKVTLVHNSSLVTKQHLHATRIKLIPTAWHRARNSALHTHYHAPTEPHHHCCTRGGNQSSHLQPNTAQTQQTLPSTHDSSPVPTFRRLRMRALRYPDDIFFMGGGNSDGSLNFHSVDDGVLTLNQSTRGVYTAPARVCRAGVAGPSSGIYFMMDHPEKGITVTGGRVRGKRYRFKRKHLVMVGDRGEPPAPAPAQ
eukprot:jgi/Chlat1/1429/Chrsp12S02062